MGGEEINATDCGIYAALKEYDATAKWINFQ